MKQWSLTLHGPTGVLTQFESVEAQFVVGSEEAGDVLRIVGEGVAGRHAWVWLAGERMQVEELGSGLDTLVNGHAITGRVEVEYPASVQVGEVTLVMEDNGVEGQVREAAAEPVPPVSTMLGEVTIPQRSPDCSQIGSLSSR